MLPLWTLDSFNNILFFTNFLKNLTLNIPLKKHFAHRDDYKLNTSLHKLNRIFWCQTNQNKNLLHWEKLKIFKPLETKTDTLH